MTVNDDFFSQLREYAIKASGTSGSKEFEEMLSDGIAAANARITYGKGFPILIRDPRKDNPFWRFLLMHINTSDEEALSGYRGMMVSQLEEIRSLNRFVYGKRPFVIMSGE
jgi:hypothetical protein